MPEPNHFRVVGTLDETFEVSASAETRTVRTKLAAKLIELSRAFA